MAAEEEGSIIVEGREEEMVSSLSSQQPFKRKAWFLSPISTSRQPFAPPHYKPIFKSIADAPPVLFKGWRRPQRRWSRWVSKLEPIHGESWRKAGVFEAVKASTYSIRRDPSSVLGVAGFWCHETSTFIFPWGEATITLEDVTILGGFSVLGEPVRSSKPLEGDLGELELRMNRERREFSRSKGRKAGYSYWMSRYIEDDGGEIEHIAFLMLWLSRFVFPASPFCSVSKHVIPIAIRLARGARIALAPAVLGSLYRDLRAIKKHLMCRRESELHAWAPLQILQLWVWERFMDLRPKSECYVHYNEPRPARWHDVGKPLDFSFVAAVIESPNVFLWRPYVTPLDSWRSPPFYTYRGEWVYGNAAGNEELGVFACCFRASELVGLDCIEQYLPHRVALQFGLDQDVPEYVPRANSTWEVAWGTYDVGAKNVVFYVPPRLLESDISLRYAIWWRRIKELFKKKRKRMVDQSRRRKKRSRDLYDVPSPERSVKKQVNAREASIYPAVKDAARESIIYRAVELSSAISETMNQSDNVHIENGLEKRMPLEEVGASGASDITNGMQKDTKKDNVEESSYDLIIIDKEAKSQMEEREQIEVRGKRIASEMEIKRRMEEERDMEIERRKKVISILEARLREMQAKYKVHS